MATLAVLIALTGCNDPMVKRQMGRREASMSWTVNTAVKNEQAAPQRLNDSFAFIGKDTVWHAQATDRDLHDLQGYLEFDLHRFKERQAEYLKKGGEILWSEPEQIGRSAAIMFL